MEQRTLSAAIRFYCEKELVGAHGAEADATATYEILEAQVDTLSQPWRYAGNDLQIVQ